MVPVSGLRAFVNACVPYMGQKWKSRHWRAEFRLKYAGDTFSKGYLP